MKGKSMEKQSAILHGNCHDTDGLSRVIDYWMADGYEVKTSYVVGDRVFIIVAKPLKEEGEEE